MEKIAIYGVGAFGDVFYHAMKDSYEIEFFIDEYTDKDFFYNKNIYKAKKSPLLKVFISVLQHSKKIEEELCSLGFKEIVSFQNSVLLNPKIFKLLAKKNYLWLVDDKKQMISDKIDEVREILCDKKSKEVLDNFVNFRKELNPEFYVKPKDKEYFPSDIKLFKKNEKLNILDCGAYIGDSLEDFILNFKNVNNIISFEPDANNIELLSNNVNLLKDKFPSCNFLVYPCGVYSENKVLKFNNMIASSSSYIDEESLIEVPVVSLDKTVIGMKINYIKMDIEGAEKDAILGAKNIIKKYKPTLAICLYHKPEDLWELPLLIKKIEPSYDMYIRVHEDMFLSTVLYCISKEDNV